MKTIEEATNCIPGHFSKLPILPSEVVMLLTWMLCDTRKSFKALCYAEIYINPEKAKAGNGFWKFWGTKK